jgi:hypothetical protein
VVGSSPCLRSRAPSWTAALLALTLAGGAAAQTRGAPTPRDGEPSLADHPDADMHPAWRSGVTFALGVGEPYGALGGDLALYLRVARRRLVLAPHVALGHMPAGYDLPWQTGVRGGLLVMFGGRNRLLFDLAYGAVGAGAVVLHGAAVAPRLIEGVSLLGGYEWMWDSGLLLRASAGPAYITESLYPDGDRLDFLFGVGVGWKPW